MQPNLFNEKSAYFLNYNPGNLPQSKLLPNNPLFFMVEMCHLVVGVMVEVS